MLTATALLAAAALSASGQQPVRLDTVRTTVSSRVSTGAAAARTVDVISRRELARRRGESLAQVLAAHLGVDVYTRSPAQADLALRGSSIDQVLVLVDGHRVSDQQTGHFNLDLAVPMDLVDHIEILRGTGSTLYGPDAVGGVVNIVTRGHPASQAARVSSGSFGTLEASLARTGALGPFDTQAGVDFARSDGHRNDTDYRVLQGRAAAGTAVGAGRLHGAVGIGVRDFGAAQFYAPYPSYEDTHTSTAQLDYQAPLGTRWTVSSSASGRRHVDLFTLIRDNPGVYQNHHDNWQTGGNVTVRYAPSDDAGVAFGTEAFDARLVSNSLGDRDETRTAAFAEVHVGSPTRTSVNLGVRGDHSSVYGDFLSPSAAASVMVAPRARLRASIGRGFRAPTWTDRFYVDPGNIGNPDLQPERFWAGELGVNVALHAQAHLDVALYQRNADNLIDWARPAGSPDSVPWHTLNVESARYRGVEATLGGAHAAGLDWTLRASGLRFEPVGDSGFEGKYALRPITRTIGGTASLPRTHGVDATLDILSARRAGEDGYFRADLRLGCTWRATRFTVDLRNLTGADYLDASGRPVAGRGAYVGLAWAAVGN